MDEKVSRKNEYRSYYRELRNGMSEEEVSSLSARICRNLTGSGLFRDAERIYAYAPLGNEADVRPVVEEAWRQGKRVAFPKVFGEDMRYFEVWDFGQLEKGAFGVMEPAGDAGAVPVDWREQSVTVLLPGVAFDRKGTRMGFGRGYYDRHFAAAGSCILVGISYALQVAESLPAQEHDLAAAYLVTEDGIYLAGK